MTVIDAQYLRDADGDVVQVVGTRLGRNAIDT